MEEKRLFLLDAYALIYRAYYALIRAPRVTTYGLNTSAIFGFCNTLHEVLTKEQPTHIAVCFDPHGPTFRHEMYAEYKAGRDAQPEDITTSIPFIKEILHAYNIPVIEQQGYEADDVIGTLSRIAEAEGFTTYMMTPDKDYGQLVTDHVLMYRPSLRGEGFEIRGPQEITEKYGISSPLQVIDLLALEGDKADNIPGCPGVGEKTAARLINEWGSVENLLANTDKLKGALQKKITDNADSIEFSKTLATINTQVPLPPQLTIESLRRRPLDASRLTEIFTKLEFRTFLRRIAPEQPEAPHPTPTEGSMGSLFDEPDTDATPAVTAISDTRYITAASAHDLLAHLGNAGCVGLAMHLDSLSAMNARCLGVAFSTADGHAMYLPLDGLTATLRDIAPAFTQASGATIVGHDIKTAYIVLRNSGVQMHAPYFDTSVAHYLLEPEMKHQLPVIAQKYLGLQMSAAANDYLSSRKPVTLDEPTACRVMCEIADVTHRLHHVLSRQLDDAALMPLLTDIELPLTHVLAEMEYTGVRIDPIELKRLGDNFTARMHALEKEAFEIAGTEFNVSSPSQVGEILFERLGIDPKAKRTKRGAYSTTEEVLERYSAEHPIAGLILKIRALKKLISTYIDALPRLINPTTGRIHTTYNQTVTATGRISSTDPNLQNIPIRSDDGAAIRRAFIPSSGNIMLSADYSQIELRLIADLSGDEGMIEAFNSGEDFHRATAARIYHLPLTEVSDNQRRNAKTANFGIIYGISAFGLSTRLGIPRSEAKELIENYMLTYPGVHDYMQRSIEHARDKGYVTTVKGRKRMLPDINSRNAVVRGYAERNAINAPLQGSAADIIKIAMNRLDSEMSRRGMRSRMIMQVHDELVFDVVPDELATLQQLVVSTMEHAYSGRVNLEVSAGVGVNWLEAH